MALRVHIAILLVTDDSGPRRSQLADVYGAA
jgi:hypothetical protein